jgi:hypothetical protein
MTPRTSISQPQACPRCRLPVTPAMPQALVADRALHRECYIAWHFGQTGRYPRRLGGGRSAAPGSVQ